MCNQRLHAVTARTRSPDKAVKTLKVAWPKVRSTTNKEFYSLHRDDEEIERKTKAISVGDALLWARV